MTRSLHVGPVYHFPQLREGDCMYDIFSRFHEQSGHFTSQATSKELFSTCPDLRASIYLPYHAELIYSWLGPDSNIRMEALRDYHSAWPFLQLCSEFSEKALSPVICKEMKPGRRKQTRMVSCLRRNLTHLRYCPLCLVADSHNVGEPYWHQVHQLSGVKYCPIHGIPLLNSSVSIASRLMRFIPASQLLKECPLEEQIRTAEHLMNVEDDYRGQYLTLATTIDYLLKHGLELDRNMLMSRYRRALNIDGETPITGGQLEQLLLLNGKSFLEDLFPGNECMEMLEDVRVRGFSALMPLQHALLFMNSSELRRF